MENKTIKINKIKLTKKEPAKNWIKKHKKLLNNVGKAIAQYGMIKEGDKIMLGLSGGKDSMALLTILKHLQRHSPINFQLAACTIDPKIPGFDPSPLKGWLKKMDIPYFCISEDMVALAENHMQGDSFCSFCARQKRGKLYKICREEGYNVLALAQHLDDLSESFILSAFYAGELRTMKAHYLNNSKDIRIIRPLIKVREADTKKFTLEQNIPVIEDNCPACYAKPQQRQRIKQLLLTEEKNNKHLYANLLKAMQPLIADDNNGDFKILS